VLLVVAVQLLVRAVEQPAVDVVVVVLLQQHERLVAVDDERQKRQNLARQWDCWSYHFDQRRRHNLYPC